MKDLFGREAKRGDIIAYGQTSLSNFNKFAETKLGIVANYIPEGKKYKVFDRNTRKPLLDGNNQQVYQETISKLTIIPIDFSDSNLHKRLVSGVIAKSKISKSGKLKRGVVLTTKFLKINKEDLSEDWNEVYEEVCKACQIC